MYYLLIYAWSGHDKEEVNFGDCEIDGLQIVGYTFEAVYILKSRCCLLQKGAINVIETITPSWNL